MKNTIEKREEFYDNGELKFRFYEDENKLTQDFYELYDRHGNLIMKGNWENDTKIGLWNYNNKEFLYYL